MINNKILQAINLLQCPNCGGNFQLFKKDKIGCEKCHKEYPIINRNIFQFEKNKISDNVLEKTMYGPEYDELKNEINDLENFSILAKQQLIFEKSPIALDYGCGSSKQVFELANKFKSDIVFGIDYDLNPLKIISQVINEYDYENIFLIQYSKEKIPFKNEVFDVITAHQVLEHTNNPEFVIKNIASKMKTGAFFEADFPNGNSIGEISRALFHKITNTKNPHISRINFDKAESFFSNSGLSIGFFQPTQAISGPIIYLIEGFILRFIFKKYKLFETRKIYRNSIFFKFLNKIEDVIMRFFPRFAHDFRFILSKI